MTEITLKLTFEELKIIDKFVELNDETRPLFDKIQNAYPKPETLLDVIRNLGYSYDMCYEIVDAVEKFEKSKEPEKWDVVRESVKWCEENPDKDPLDWLKPQTPEQTEQGLKEAFREAVKQGVVSSSTKSKTLTDIVYDWWCDIFTSHSDLDMEASIEDLVDRIELFLPKEQSAAGSQNAYVECSVEGFNDCLNKIKRKLR